jgi:selenoprotein W-related protein
VSLTEHLLTKYQLRIRELKLLPHYGGVFEVTINGDLIYSKRVTGRFPEDAEIDAEIDDYLKGEP